MQTMDFTTQPKNGKSTTAALSSSRKQPEAGHSLVQLRKVMLMLPVTLISLFLIISSFFLYANAEATFVGQANNYPEFADNALNEEGQEHAGRQELEKSRAQQANDILTKLTHSQGHIHHYNHDYHLGSKIVDADPRNPHVRELRAKLDFEIRQMKRFFPQVKTETRAKSEAELGSGGISCKDENGEDVSWYVLYKLPQIPTSSDSLTRNGSKYYYLLPGRAAWTPSELPINGNGSQLAWTLLPFWNSAHKDLSHVIYNDQPPSKPAVVMNGHTKGLVITSTRGGLWLQHSCPHFPDTSAPDFTSSYPPGGLINGQMFLCMTFRNTSIVDEVGRVLQYTKPAIYNFSIPHSMNTLIPELAQVVEKNATVTKAPWFNTFQMETGNTASVSLKLKVLAKGPKFREEIYSAWIAPEYGVSLDVQSWLNGAHPFLSNCTSEKYPVYNILEKDVNGQNFSYIDDHSKWAVGTDKSKPVVCIGDLNRMKPQKTRGGVTICFQDQVVWSAFKNLVIETQPCNATRLSMSKNKKSHKHKFQNKFRA